MKKIINFAIIGLINLVIFNVVILAETRAEKQPLFLKSNTKRAQFQFVPLNVMRG